ncbi:transposase (plasmid) [Tundrisphaera lichenicola]|uniref:transposase n=1 Tax=Tundrisphaera lichenicola TaxID=2029860 RepID=UPI003EBCDD94
MATELVCPSRGARRCDSLPLSHNLSPGGQYDWSIENGCHWTLDVTYREDESRLREKLLSENMAWLNRFSLSLLRQHPGRQSVAMKRRSCGWSNDFLMQVVKASMY